MFITSVCTADPWIMSQVIDGRETGDFARGEDNNFRLFSGRSHS